MRPWESVPAAGRVGPPAGQAEAADEPARDPRDAQLEAATLRVHSSATPSLGYSSNDAKRLG
jgi:hypothetical protein